MSDPNERDDTELLEAWRAGDEAAGSALFHRHFDAVRRFFANKIADGVDDLVQQTFTACVSKKDGIHGKQGVRAYLYAVARSKLYDELGRRARTPAFRGDSVSLADLGIAPSQALREREDLQLVVQALRHLPMDLQIALELYYIEGVKGPDLSVALGVPEGTVRSRVRRALQLLRTRIDELAAAPELRRDTASTLANWQNKSTSSTARTDLPHAGETVPHRAVAKANSQTTLAETGNAGSNEA